MAHEGNLLVKFFHQSIEIQTGLGINRVDTVISCFNQAVDDFGCITVGLEKSLEIV